ncbi:putative phage tail protein [Virgibacillus sp. FSP13]
MIFNVDNLTTSERLLNMLPDYYKKSLVMKEIMKSDGAELGIIQDGLDDILLQFYIDTATWSITLWEKEYDVEQKSHKPIEERREVVKSRMNKGDTSYAVLIKRVADAYTNGDVETKFENGVVVKFTSFYGIPSNLDDVRISLERIIPAHLPLIFKYSYVLIKEIHGVKTLHEMEQLTLNKFAGGA